jgi:hypothetical protein
MVVNQTGDVVFQELFFVLLKKADDLFAVGRVSARKPKVQLLTLRANRRCR